MSCTRTSCASRYVLHQHLTHPPPPPPPPPSPHDAPVFEVHARFLVQMARVYILVKQMCCLLFPSEEVLCACAPVPHSLHSLQVSVYLLLLLEFFFNRFCVVFEILPVSLWCRCVQKIKTRHVLVCSAQRTGLDNQCIK